MSTLEQHSETGRGVDHNQRNAISMSASPVSLWPEQTAPKAHCQGL